MAHDSITRRALFLYMGPGGTSSVLPPHWPGNTVRRPTPRCVVCLCTLVVPTMQAMLSQPAAF